MEEENEMDFNENRAENQPKGAELSEDALAGAAGGAGRWEGYVCERCGRNYYGFPEFVQDGEVIKSVCNLCYQKYYEQPSPDTSNRFR